MDTRSDVAQKYISVHRPTVLPLALYGWAAVASGLLIGVPTPVRLPADVDDAYSLRHNPAGLGFINGSELRLLYGRDLPRRSDSGVALLPDATNGLGLFGATNLFGGTTLAGAFELDVLPSGKTAQRTAIGLGFGGPGAALGIGFDHFSPPAGDAKNALLTGLTLRFLPWLSTALAVRDLAQTAGRRNYDLGLALRPFGDRALISSRWRVVQGESLIGDNLDLAGRIEVEPIAGLFLGVGANYVKRGSDDNIGVTAQLGFAVDGLFIASSIEDTTLSTAIAAEIAYRSAPRPSIVSQSRVAVLDLEGALVPDPKFSLLSRSFEVTPYGTVPLLLDELSQDHAALGLYLRISSLSIGWGKAQEIRDLILGFRSSGRRVDCELRGSGDLEYFLASACNTIGIAPAASLELNGVAANVVFFAEALDKLGVKVDYVARGRFKSFPEQFSRSTMSPAQKEALGAYVDRVYETLIEGIGRGRKLERAKVEEVIARGAVTATEAVSLHLVDKVLYPDEIDEHLNRLYGGRVSFVAASRLARTRRPHWTRYPKIAVLHIDAAITGGESRDSPLFFGHSAGAETIVAGLEHAKNDPSIAAVVLRVDSPGGDSLASDLIARAVQLCNAEKPVIASFGDTAASGGYYVAANARAIYAEPTTLTGSIGVFSIRVSLSGLASKLGVSGDSVERGPLSNSRNIFHEMTPPERALMEKGVDDAYTKFLEVVSRGRKKRVEEVREIAEGRIWSGLAARGNGLVDEIGGLVDAIQRAKIEAGLPADGRVEIVSLPANRTDLPDAARLAFAEVLAPPGAPSTAWLGELFPHRMKQAVGALADRAIHAGDNAPLALVPFVLDID